MPVCDFANTNSEKISILYDEPVSVGTVLLDIEVQFDDGQGNGFVTISGGHLGAHLSSALSVCEHCAHQAALKRGMFYQFRYRGRNAVGWSEFSPVASIQAARVPSKPLKPSIVGATSTTITIQVGICEDNGGDSLLDYTVYRDQGQLMSAFVPLHSQLFVNDFTFTAEDLTPGLLYHFRVTATNRIGESLPSEETGYYAASVPEKPAPLQKGSVSSRSQIELSWPV
jgi:hypothetical protein